MKNKSNQSNNTPKIERLLKIEREFKVMNVIGINEELSRICQNIPYELELTPPVGFAVIKKPGSLWMENLDIVPVEDFIDKGKISKRDQGLLVFLQVKSVQLFMQEEYCGFEFICYGGKRYQAVDCDD